MPKDFKRFEDTPELFGGEVGGGTCGDIECSFCGSKYNQGNDAKEEYNGDSVTWTEFAGLVACSCCFDKIEEEVWGRRGDILLWMDRRMERYQKNLDKDREKLGAVFCKIVNSAILKEKGNGV